MFRFPAILAFAVLVGQLGALNVAEANDAPVIQNFSATVLPGNVLWVEGNIIDENIPQVTLYIYFLDVQFDDATIDENGHFTWGISIGPDDEGWISAVAYDVFGLQSNQPEDLVIPNP